MTTQQTTQSHCSKQETRSWADYRAAVNHLLNLYPLAVDTRSMKATVPRCIVGGGGAASCPLNMSGVTNTLSHLSKLRTSGSESDDNSTSLQSGVESRQEVGPEPEARPGPGPGPGLPSLPPTSSCCSFSLLQPKHPVLGSPLGSSWFPSCSLLSHIAADSLPLPATAPPLPLWTVDCRRSRSSALFIVVPRSNRGGPLGPSSLSRLF